MTTKYMRQFPGKKKWERVSKDDWELVLPNKDIAGWGQILGLTADVRVWAPDGELLVAKKWPSHSYIRNFARIMKCTFGSSTQLVDRAGNAQTTCLVNSGQNAMGFLTLLEQETTNVTQSANGEHAGAGMAIGQGVAAESHTRNDLVSRFSEIMSARQGVRTTVLNTSTLTLEITCGIVNGTAASINVTEIGLYVCCANTATAQTGLPFSSLIAYDGVTSTPLAAGGVIAPRYTMDFPM